MFLTPACDFFTYYGPYVDKVLLVGTKLAMHSTVTGKPPVLQGCDAGGIAGFSLRASGTACDDSSS